VLLPLLLILFLLTLKKIVTGNQNCENIQSDHYYSIKNIVSQQFVLCIMSLRNNITDRIDSDVSSTISEDNQDRVATNKELLGNIIVCAEDNPYLDNVEDDSGKELVYSGKVHHLFMFDEIDGDIFSGDHFWNNPLFAKRYAVLYNRNLRDLIYHSRRQCRNSVGGKELRCRCLSVLRRNKELLHQATEMMTSYQVCQEEANVMFSMNITIDLSPSVITRLLTTHLESLKLLSGGNANTLLGKQKGISYSSRGGVMRWNIFKVIKQHYEKTRNKNRCYRYVCKSTVKKIFGMKKEQWDNIILQQHTEKQHTERTNEKLHAEARNEEQKIVSEEMNTNRRSGRLKITIGIEYCEDSDDSVDKNKMTSALNTVEGKKSSTITPEKKPQPEHSVELQSL